MFTTAGNQNVVITAMRVTTAKFSKNAAAFALCFEVQHPQDAGQVDHVYLDVCDDYGKGNFSQQTQYEITREKLLRLGFTDGNLYDGAYLRSLKEQAPGKTAVVMFESEDYEGKTYIRPKYFVTSKQVEELSDEELMRRITALKSNAAPQGTAAPSPTATTTPPSATTTAAAAAKPGPFGKAAPAKSPFGK